MKMVHVTKTPDGGYMIVDATGSPVGGASFAPTSSAHSEAQLKAALKRFGFTDKAIENAVAEVNHTGDTMLQL